MSYEVVFSDRAWDDLRGIYNYIAFTLQSRINADRQLDRLEREILSLSELPERCRMLSFDFGAGRRARMLTVDRYCVIYAVEKESRGVQILRILYGGSDMEARLKT